MPYNAQETINPFYVYGTPLTVSLTNSEDRAEMLYNAQETINPFYVYGTPFTVSLTNSED